MLAVLNRRIAVLSFTSALLFIYILTGMLVSSFSISNNQPLPASPLLLTASRAYSRNELLTLCCYDVTPARSVRKAIFRPIAAETEMFTCVNVGLQAALACLLQIYKEQLQSFVV
jgi:hypothetical protein